MMKGLPLIVVFVLWGTANCAVKEAPMADPNSYIPIASVCEVPVVEHSRITPAIAEGEFYKAGDTIDIGCEPGYHSLNVNHLNYLCLDDGVWDEELPICQVITCKLPESPKNGYLALLEGHVAKNRSFPFGTEIAYSCNVEYRLVGPQFRWCEEHGWSGDEPQCQIIACEEIPEVENAAVSGKKDIYLPGEEIEVKCNKGYRGASGGKSLLICSPEGTWNTAQSSCAAATCPAPDAPEHGFIKVEVDGERRTVYHFLESVTFGCDNGYSLVGKKVHYCRAEGWSEAFPTCKAIQCPRPQVPENGQIEEANEFKEIYVYGENVTFKCRDWHRLSGSAKRTCSETGWTGHPVECKVQGCPPPPAARESAFIYWVKKSWNRFTKAVGLSSFGNQLSVQCPTGYRPDKQQPGVCQEDGRWSQVPGCVEITCRRPPNLNNGFIEGLTSALWQRYASSITYRCTNGYRLRGKTTRTCKEEGWTGAAPTCHEILCPSPSVSNGRAHVINGFWRFPRFSQIRIACDEGYSLKGSNSIVECNSEGKWNESLNKCKALDCHNPAIIPNALSQTNTRYNVGDTIDIHDLQYICRLGYRLQPTNGILTCSMDGWKGPELNCEEVTCPDPQLLPNGYIRSSSVPPGRQYSIESTVAFECHPGFRLIGNRIHKCTERGWVGGSLFCQAVMCNLPTVVNGELRTFAGKDSLSSYFSVRSDILVEIQCSNGYRFKGMSSVIQCGSDGKWNATSLQCEVVGCTLPKITNSNIVPLNIYQPSPNNNQRTGRLLQAPSGTLTLTQSLSANTNQPLPEHQIPPTGQQLTSRTASQPSAQTVHQSPQTSPEPPALTSEHYPQLPTGNQPSPTRTMYSGSQRLPGYSSSEFIHEQQPQSRQAPSDYSNPSSTGYSYDGTSLHILYPTSLRYRRSQKYESLDEPQVMLPNSLIKIECGHGYRYRGQSPIAKCNQNGKWNVTMGECEEITCNPPRDDIPNSVLLKKTSYSFGTDAEYKCFYGYQLYPPGGVLTCTEYGWNGPQLQCKEVECPLPKEIINGFFESSIELGEKDAGFPLGTTLTYSCNKPYRINGEQLIRCLSSGTWSAEPPLCEETYCTKPYVDHADPIGGHFKYEPGASITVSCLPGFRIGNVTSLQCKPDGGWDPPSLQCKEILCNRPPALVFGEILPNKPYYKFGEKVRYRCQNNNINLKGQRERMCTANGWEGEDPECVAKKDISCSVPPTLLDSGHSVHVPPDSEEFRFGDTLIVTCKLGFEPLFTLRRNTIICTPHGNWSTHFVNCIESNQAGCPAPPVLKNGHLIGTKEVYNPGDTLAVACDSGYRPVNGTDYLSCNSSGIWDDRFTQCEAVWCKPPQCPANGSVEYDDFGPNDLWPFHSEANFFCSPGFQLVGYHWIKCLQNGWSSSTPQCREISCVHPGMPEEGWMKGDFFGLGARIQFGCFTGYELIGPKERICLPNGQWSEQQPYCSSGKTACPGLPEPVGGSKIGSSFNEGAEVSFTCIPGYVLTGSLRRKCVNGRWTGTETRCIGLHQFNNPEEISQNLQVSLKKISDEQDSLLTQKPPGAASVGSPRSASLVAPTHIIVYLVLDASSRVGSKNFERQKEVAEAIIKKLDISKSGTRVGLLTVSSQATAEFYPADFYSQHNVLDALRQISYKEGQTSLQAALEILGDMMQETKTNLERGVAKNHVFLFTDGKFKPGLNPISVAQRLVKQHGATFTCIALTGQWRKEVLYAIAAEQPRNVHFLHSFNVLHWLANQITRNTLDYSRCGRGLDSVSEPSYLRSHGIKATNFTFPWPWTAFISDQSKPICKGSLINSKWILTSALCVTSKDGIISPDDLAVDIGFVSGSLLVGQIFVHPHYNNFTLDYNAALLELEEDVELSEALRPVCLPGLYEEVNNTLYSPQEYGYASARVNIKPGGKAKLKHIPLPIERREMCATALKQRNYTINNTTFCAGNGQDHPDGSHGDNGGPLIQLQRDNEGYPIWIQVGITSFQEGSFYSYYTNVSKLMNWIRTYAVL